MFYERDPKARKQNEFWLAGKQLTQGYCLKNLSVTQRKFRHERYPGKASVSRDSGP